MIVFGLRNAATSMAHARVDVAVCLGARINQHHIERAEIAVSLQVFHRRSQSYTSFHFFAPPISVHPPPLSACSPCLSLSVPPSSSRYVSVGVCLSLFVGGFSHPVKCEGDVVHEGVAGRPEMRFQPDHCFDAERGRHRVFVV